MEKDLTFIKNALPKHYICEPREEGVFCYSPIGIVSDDDWDEFINKLKSHFGDHFSEIYHSVCTNHTKFTIYIDQ